jgi:hypothetical protein
MFSPVKPTLHRKVIQRGNTATKALDHQGQN